jgi:hypothetical protein
MNNNFFAVLPIVFLLILFINSNQFFAQSTSKKPTEKTATQSENPNLLRWKTYLFSLEQEAKTSLPIERRPFAIADVAEVYWLTDKETSKNLFISAIDLAWNEVEKDSKKSKMLNYVISKATKTDSELSKILTKRLIDKEDSISERDDISSSVALELLKDDAKKSEQLAESFAPNGLQNGMANFFIFRLAAQDIQLSNQLHSVYTNKVTANDNLPVEWLVSLSGYAFGYKEFYTIDKSGQLIGATFPQVKNLPTNALLAKTIIDSSFRKISKAVQLRNNLSGAELDGLNYAINFSIEYLLPEVAKFSPNSLTNWQQLQQQGVATTTPQILETIAAHIQSIRQNRERMQKYEEPNQTMLDKEIDESLENAEKIADACQRDTIYSKAALNLASRKNFKKALDIAGKISDLNKINNVKEVIFYDIALAEIENENVDNAETSLKNISSPELKAVLYSKSAVLAFKKNDKISGSNFVDSGIKILEKFQSEELKAGFLFNFASLTMKTDKLASETTFRNAIKELNKKSPPNIFRFSVPIRVSFSCTDDNSEWYGGSISLPNTDIFQVSDLLAKENPDNALLLADELTDKILKIRVNSIIAKNALTNLINKKAKL